MPAAWLVAVESTWSRPWWLSPKSSLRGAWGRGSLARAAEGFDSRRQTFRLKRGGPLLLDVVHLFATHVLHPLVLFLMRNITLSVPS
jgi:hypothetical protein